jgi:DNA repair exonuclease SbcCD ATPase subunit
MDKTIKLRAFSGDNGEGKKSNLTEEQQKLLELSAQLEEEKKRSLDNLKTITQLRESLKQEQAKTAGLAGKLAELETRVKNTPVVKVDEEAVKKVQLQLEEEKKKVLEQTKKFEQLQESLKREQTRTDEMTARMAEQEGKLKEVAALEIRVKELEGMETKVKEMTEALSKISGLAAFKAG